MSIRYRFRSMPKVLCCMGFAKRRNCLTYSSDNELTRREFMKLLPPGIIVSVSTLERLSSAVYAGTGERACRTADSISRVALVKGDDRGDNIHKAMTLIEEDIREDIGDKQVVIKPNFVSVRRQLAATHVDSVRAILEFLRPFYKKPVMIAESPASAPAEVGFQNFGYKRYLKEYDVTFLDLDDAGYERLFIIDKNLHPLPIRISRLLLEPDIYLISAAMLKTHDAVVVTLSLKNVVMGAPLRGEKSKVHQGVRQINFNLFSLAQRIKPNLAVIDGFQGMEGCGPIGGDPIDTKVAIASTDFLAADRIAVEVMGIDFSNVGYLNYCAEAEMGVVDLSNITLVGYDLSKCRRKFRLHRKVEEQYLWR